MSTELNQNICVLFSFLFLNKCFPIAEIELISCTKNTTKPFIWKIFTTNAHVYVIEKKTHSDTEMRIFGWK